MKRLRQKNSIFVSILGLTTLLQTQLVPFNLVSTEAYGELRAGAVVIVKNEPNKTFLGSQLLSKVGNLDIQMGAVSTYSPELVPLWSYKKDHGVYTWKQKLVSVKHIPLQAASFIRLPNNVAERLENADKEEKEQQKTKRKSALNIINGDTTPLCINPPIRSKIISQFASPRYLNNGNSYYHSGVDLRAFVPTKVRAVTSGTVVLAESMIVPGNTVTVDHGGGLLSSYLHLSEIKVKPGDVVTKDTVIGLSGDTGRVEGPHLHWEMHWKGMPIDPLSVLENWKSFCVQSSDALASKNSSI